MPTTYTHYRFGGDCLRALPEELGAAASAHRGLFDTGVHGPDIFFYYHAVTPNSVSAYGSKLHHYTGKQIFTRALGPWHAYRDKETMLAYLLGFLCHFTLDSVCHGYVNGSLKELGVSHNRLEAVYDAHLMLRDGLTPTQVMRGETLEPTEPNAEIISRFFDVPVRKVYAALCGQEQIMRLLCSPGGTKKRVARAALRVLHLPGHLDDLFIDDEVPPELDGAMAELDRLYDSALAEYPAMAQELVSFLDGNGELSARFDRDFE